jgi:hypothetical protein
MNMTEYERAGSSRRHQQVVPLQQGPKAGKQVFLACSEAVDLEQSINPKESIQKTLAWTQAVSDDDINKSLLSRRHKSQNRLSLHQPYPTSLA